MQGKRLVSTDKQSLMQNRELINSGVNNWRFIQDLRQKGRSWLVPTKIEKI